MTPRFRAFVLVLGEALALLSILAMLLVMLVIGSAFDQSRVGVVPPHALKAGAALRGAAVPADYYVEAGK